MSEFFTPPSPASVAMGAALRAGRARGTHGRAEPDEQAEQPRDQVGRFTELHGGAGHGTPFRVETQGSSLAAGGAGLTGLVAARLQATR